MKILLVGFKRYSTHENNPSELLISKIQRPDVKGLVLDINFEKAKELPAIIAEEKPDYIITMNLSPYRKEPTIEEYAYNEIRSVQPDEAGVTHTGEPIIEGGPRSLNSALDIPSLQNFLASRGVNCSISVDPGLWIDNEVSYLARYTGVPTVTIHLPLLTDYPLEDDLELIEGVFEFFDFMN